jgi:MarR family transcriptional regulator, 2-MHQ and catechol-resistance regulon repressor
VTRNAPARETAPTGVAAADAHAELAADSRITAMGLVSEVYNGLVAKTLPQLAEHGVAPAEFEVLLRLSRSAGGRLRMSDLAAQTSLTSSGITRLVDRLERGGLLRRTACPSDRRGLFAELTDTGWERIEAVVPGHVELIDQWLIGLLEPGEREQFLATLRKLRDIVRPGATAGAAGPTDAAAHG